MHIWPETLGSIIGIHSLMNLNFQASHLFSFYNNFKLGTYFHYILWSLKIIFQTTGIFMLNFKVGNIVDNSFMLYYPEYKRYWHLSITDETFRGHTDRHLNKISTNHMLDMHSRILHTPKHPSNFDLLVRLFLTRYASYFGRSEGRRLCQSPAWLRRVLGSSPQETCRR